MTSLATITALLTTLLAGVGGSFSDAVHRRLERDLDELGIVDPAKRRRLTGKTLHDLERRLVAGLRRNLEQDLVTRGWTPPSAVEPLTAHNPALAPESVEAKVLRWARQRTEFTARDVQRALDWFETAAEVKACLAGLIARGHLESLPLHRPKGSRGRMPSPRYRALPMPDGPTQQSVSEEPPKLSWPEPVESQLDWPVED
jgi:hypothetical protein